MEALITTLFALGKWLLGAFFAILLGIGTWAVKRVINTYTKEETNAVIKDAVASVHEKMTWRDEQMAQQTATLKEIAKSLQILHTNIARHEAKVEDIKERLDRSNL